jgi:cysteinyl-tRNA synthetase
MTTDDADYAGPLHTTLPEISGEAMGGMALRLNMLMTHYRKPLDFTATRLKEADKTYRKWLSIARREDGTDVPVEILDAICADMNTPLAVALMHGYAKRREGGKLFAAMKLLGLLPHVPGAPLVDMDGMKMLDQENLENCPHVGYAC